MTLRAIREVVPLPDAWPGMVAPVCRSCRSAPCLCLLPRPCQCGGAILAAGDVREAVRAHQASPLHAAWREANGL